METTSPAAGPVVVLIGNFPPDRQESMLRFHDLIRSRLVADGVTVESIFPREVLGRNAAHGGLAKWLGYVDKYVFFPLALPGLLAALRRRHAGRRIVVHICDHANAVYAGTARRFFPVLVTCHDLLAVRGARGEDTDCPASGFGRHLQTAIFHGILRANEVVCVSRATRTDLLRLAGDQVPGQVEVVPLSLNYPYRALPREQAMAALRSAGLSVEWRSYMLHVGSSSRRKNREAVLSTLAQVKDVWPGAVVLAGDPMTPAEHALARKLGVADRVRELRPDNETLVALYSAALALIFPSRFEGFGWPILEAQMAGCPVICSNRTSVPEVAGEGGLVHEPDDYAGMAADLLRLTDETYHAEVAARGLANAQTYTTERMMQSYQAAYRRLA